MNIAYLLERFLHTRHAATVVIRFKVVNTLNCSRQESCTDVKVTTPLVIDWHTSSEWAVSDNTNAEFATGL